MSLRVVLLLVVASIAGGCATAKYQELPNAAVQQYVTALGQRILAVTEKANDAAKYEFKLSELRKHGALGVSVGNHVIYIDHEFAQKNYQTLGGRTTTHFPPYLAMVLAHEIAHDIAGHAVKGEAISTVTTTGQLVGRGLSYVPGPIGWAGAGVSWLMYGAGTASAYLYGREQELEADRKAIAYWKALRWRCEVWVERFQLLADKGITGDFRHPTEGRLAQARALCAEGEGR